MRRTSRPSRHVLVLRGHAARAGGDVELLHRFHGCVPAEPRVRRAPPFRDVAHTEGFLLRPPIRPGGSPVVDERCIDCDRGSHVVSIVRTRERRHSRPVLPNPRSPPFELQLTMIISSPLSSPRHDVARRRASHPGRLQQRTETQGPAQPPHGGQGANGEVIRFGA